MGFVLDVQNIMDANAVSEEIVFLKTTNCLSPKFVKYFTAGLIRFQSPLLKALRKCDKQPCRIGISTYAMYAAGGWFEILFKLGGQMSMFKLMRPI